MYMLILAAVVFVFVMPMLIGSRYFPYLWWVLLGCAYSGIASMAEARALFVGLATDAGNGCPMCALVLAFMTCTAALLLWTPVEMIHNDRQYRANVARYITQKGA